jgi:S-adenosylmethionine:tRNA ribosyltransferase-isomerase
MSLLSDYQYDLPRHLIAQQPLRQRSDARLLVVDRARGTLAHHHVRDLPTLLVPPDCLVINETRVVPARIVGRRTNTGGWWEGLYLESDEQGCWLLLAKTRGKPTGGETITLVDCRGRDDVQLRLLEKRAGGVWVARPESDAPTLEILERIGRIPLPHYIRGGEMQPEDRQRYQTVFAEHPGSAAAPTAGLHLTRELLSELEHRGVEICRLTLHVGLDTFRPLDVERLADHQMHSERGSLDAHVAERINRRRAAGGRVVAVGTTTVRVLETAASETGRLAAWHGKTDLFIRPPYSFRVVDTLLTNFHLPRSTLLVLVRTFGGHQLVMRAYEEAIREKYRFFSYGDAMLIV